MIHPRERNDVTVRSVVVIAPDRTVRLVFAYPPNTGRNFREVLRALDALQLTRRHQVATPVDWQPGDEVILLPPHAEAG
jgi:thioredoxin-dependent peroxiredoxin